MEYRNTPYGRDTIYGYKAQTRERVIGGRKMKVTAVAQFYSLGGRQRPYLSITVEKSFEILPRGGRRSGSCGCCHDLIAKMWPEWAHMLKWHLVSDEGPTHYIANALHHASEKDCWGFLKDQQKTDKKSGRPLWSIRPQPLHSYVEGNTKEEAVEAYVKTLIVEPVLGEGKVPEFDHFRSTAIWPEITNDQIIELRNSGKLKEALEARLPALMEQFFTDLRDFFGKEMRGLHQVTE